MGLELKLLAIPDNSKVFEFAGISPDFGESLEFLHSYYSDQNARSKSDSEIDRLYLAEAARLKKANPGIENRKLYLDKDWDILHFLLSEERRKGNARQESKDMGTLAIWGEMDLHENAVATQGAPIRHLSSGSAKKVAAWLAEIDEATLKTFYQPEKMEEEGVYKFWVNEFAEENFAFYFARFLELRSFYKSLLEHTEGCLMILD